AGAQDHRLVPADHRGEGRGVAGVSVTAQQLAVRHRLRAVAHGPAGSPFQLLAPVESRLDHALLHSRPREEEAARAAVISEFWKRSDRKARHITERTRRSSDGDAARRGLLRWNGATTGDGLRTAGVAGKNHRANLQAFTPLVCRQGTSDQSP